MQYKVGFLFYFKNKKRQNGGNRREKPILKQNIRFKICNIDRAFCFILKIKKRQKLEIKEEKPVFKQNHGLKYIK